MTEGREIRFRGQRVDTKEWVYGYLSFFYVDGKNEKGFIYADKARIYSQDDALSYDVIAESVGQFIGVLDKTGKEFCSGDIITKDGKHFSIIEYENGGYFARAFSYGKYHHAGFHHISMTTREYYIVGNKMENPEYFKDVKS